MGLYLCVFVSNDSDHELEGVEVGSYDDFNLLRTTIAERLEGGAWASRFPVLMSHPDSDGEWTAQEALTLGRELQTIQIELGALPSSGFPEGSWQSAVAMAIGVAPTSLADCFIDIDGEPLLERLRDLAKVAVGHDRAISFQ